MYCPKCRYEYKEGVTKCPDCGVDLVVKLPPEDTEEYIEYTEILETFNPGDVAILKSILDEEDITYYFHGENFGRMGAMMEPSRLMVKTDEADEARELISGLKLNTNAINVSNEGEEEEVEEEA
jgi:hypothetical protein